MLLSSVNPDGDRARHDARSHSTPDVCSYSYSHDASAYFVAEDTEVVPVACRDQRGRLAGAGGGSLVPLWVPFVGTPRPTLFIRLLSTTLSSRFPHFRELRVTG